jgi:hypothetical protein
MIIELRIMYNLYVNAVVISAYSSVRTHAHVYAPARMRDSLRRVHVCVHIR